MEELILALLSGAAEILVEVAFQLICEGTTVLTVRTVRKAARKSRAVNAVLASLGYFLLGVGFGALSVLVFPHLLIRPSRVHGISLIASPLITGLIMSQFGRARRRKNKVAIRLESFGYGFTFAFGVALIRFLLVH